MGRAGFCCPVCGSELAERSETNVLLRACTGCAYREERIP